MTALARVYFAERWANHRLGDALVDRLVAAYAWFHDAGLCERKFQSAIKNRNYASYAQDLAEMLAAYRLHQAGFTLQRSPASGGPDFIVTKDGATVQLEIVTPEPLDEVSAYLNRPKEGVFSVPLNGFLLCWTKGIASKAKQLLGDDKDQGWVAKGLVDSRLPFVVAVNGCKFSTPLSEGFRPPLGGFPWAAVALYAISDPQIYLDRATGKSVGSGYEFRDKLPRGEKAPVPLDVFLDNKYQFISAVWALSLDDFDLLHDPPAALPRQSYESAVLHNPMTATAIPQGLLPAFEEWQLQRGEKENTVQRVINRIP